MDQFVKQFNCQRQMGNDGSDFGFPDSRTLSFEIPAGLKVVYPPHPNLTITSAASIAKKGEWCTLDNIEWAGGESIAKVIGGSQMWLICNEVEAGVELYKISTYPNACRVHSTRSR